MEVDFVQKNNTNPFWFWSFLFDFDAKKNIEYSQSCAVLSKFTVLGLNKKKKKIAGNINARTIK